MIVKNCGGVKSSHQQTYVPTSVRTAFPFRPLPRTSSLRPEGKAHSSVRQRAQLNAFRLKVVSYSPYSGVMTSTHGSNPCVFQTITNLCDPSFFLYCQIQQMYCKTSEIISPLSSKNNADHISFATYARLTLTMKYRGVDDEWGRRISSLQSPCPKPINLLPSILQWLNPLKALVLDCPTLFQGNNGEVRVKWILAFIHHTDAAPWLEVEWKTTNPSSWRPPFISTTRLLLSRLNRVESKIAFRLWAPKGKSKGQPIFSQRRANFNFKLSIFPRSAPNSNM